MRAINSKKTWDKQEIRVEKRDDAFWCDREPTMAQIMHHIQQLVDEGIVPETAQLRLDVAPMNCDVLRATWFWYRKETSAERDQRVRDTMEDAKEDEKAERALYEKLKQKYEPTDCVGTFLEKTKE